MRVQLWPMTGDTWMTNRQNGDHQQLPDCCDNLATKTQAEWGSALSAAGDGRATITPVIISMHFNQFDKWLLEKKRELIMENSFRREVT